jgi:hypothetical protein
MGVVWAMNSPFMDDMRSLVRRAEGKPKRGWEEHNKMSVSELSCNGVHYFWTPVTVAERSKAWTVIASSNAGIVGSNPNQGMDFWCVNTFILCLGSGHATGWSLVQGVLPSVKNDYGTE